MSNSVPGPSVEIVRRSKKGPPPSPTANWLTTFADMVTLILTFLVLMISITTLDPRIDLSMPEGAAEEREAIDRGSGVLLYSNRGLMEPVIEMLENLDRLPDNVMFDQEEIKNAVFQLDPAKTPEYEQLRTALDEKIKISKDARGLVIQWDRSLLFPEGGTIVHEDNLILLQKLAIFLQNISLPISIEGHSDPASLLEGGREAAAYELSLRRAKVVMEYLVAQGLPEKRFRIGGYGGSRPLTQDPREAWQNSRLDIVIYKPDQSSWSGN